jgi:hypothetical protein
MSDSEHPHPAGTEEEKEVILDLNESKAGSG